MPKIQKDKETKAVQEFADMGPTAAIAPLSFIPNDAYTRKQTMLKEAKKSVKNTEANRSIKRKYRQRTLCKRWFNTSR